MSEDQMTLTIGVVVLVLFLGVSFLFFFKLVPRIFKAALGPGGAGNGLSQAAHGAGWKKLAETWPAASRQPADVMKNQWVQVGLVVYRRSVTVGASEAGLYLETTGTSSVLGLPPLLIPWSAIIDRQPVRFQWMPALKLTTAPPAGTSIVLYKRVFDELGMAALMEVHS